MVQIPVYGKEAPTGRQRHRRLFCHPVGVYFVYGRSVQGFRFAPPPAYGL